MSSLSCSEFFAGESLCRYETSARSSQPYSYAHLHRGTCHAKNAFCKYEPARCVAPTNAEVFVQALGRQEAFLAHASAAWSHAIANLKQQPVIDITD
jgi:hypothetical protein